MANIIKFFFVDIIKNCLYNKIMAKIRPLGHILLELEEVILEMTSQHDLQWGDIFAVLWVGLDENMIQKQSQRKGKKIRPFGLVSINFKNLISEMKKNQKMTDKEIYELVYSYLEIHCPDSREEYVDGGNPLFYYGPKEFIKRKKG